MEKANLILGKRSIAQSSEDKSSYQNRYPYSGKIICSIHHEPYYRTVFRYKSGNKEAWQCQEYSRKGKQGCSSPILYTTELDDIVRKVLEELSIHKTEIIHELIQLYTSLGSNAKTDEDIARCKTKIEDIVKRKDKLLDLSIDGRISDEEFSLRNERFNGEITELQANLQRLEDERIKNQDMMQSIEILRQAITEELDFTNGFSVGVIDALLDHVEVTGTEDKNKVKVKVCLKAMEHNADFLIQRARGKTSVCARQYI